MLDVADSLSPSCGSKLPDISCLDSSLGRVLACGAGGRSLGGSRPDCDMCHEALLEDRDDPGQVSLYYSALCETIANFSIYVIQLLATIGNQ
jgi:hypothetical protein